MAHSNQLKRSKGRRKHASMREAQDPKVQRPPSDVWMRPVTAGSKGTAGPESRPAWLLEAWDQGCCFVGSGSCGKTDLERIPPNAES